MIKLRISRTNGNNKMTNRVKVGPGPDKDIINQCQRGSLPAFRMRCRSLMRKLRI